MDEFEAELRRLSLQFRQRCIRELDELEQLAKLDGPRPPRIKQLAHGLAGAGGTFGLPQIGTLARRVEMALEGGGPASSEISDLLAARAELAVVPAS